MDLTFPVLLADLAACLWLGYLAARALVEIASRRPRTIYFPLITLFLFFGVPLALDVAAGLPDYSLLFPGIDAAMRDRPTSLLYCVTISTAGAILWFGRPRHPPAWLQRTGFTQLQLRWYVRAAAWAALLLPFIAVVASPEPRLYLSYAAIILDETTGALATSHGLVSTATMASLAGYCILMLSARRLLFSFSAMLPFLFGSAWVNGKRYFIAYLLAATVYVLWRRGVASGRRLALIMLLFAASQAIFSQVYQSAVRNVSGATSSASEIYLGARADYGRDHVVKLALFSELHPERPPVLEYRGQSVLFTLTMYVPREMWPEKPLPYAQYVTSAAFETAPQMWGWGLTTSIIDEAINNFGLLGIVLGPLVLVVICRLGDGATSQFAGMFTGPIACALLVVEVPAFGALFVTWVAAIAWEHRPGRRHERPGIDGRLGFGHDQ